MLWTYRKHRLLRSKLVELGPELTATLWGKEPVQQILTSIYKASHRALERTSQATDEFCHLEDGGVEVDKEKRSFSFDKVWRK